jgi:hypothetical protein
VTGSVLAVSVNSPGAAVLTFYLPVGLFVVIATVLYLLFSRPHRRVPGRLATSRPGGQASGITASSAAGGPYGSVSGGAAAVPSTSPAGDASGDESADGAGTQRPTATAEGTEAGE